MQTLKVFAAHEETHVIIIVPPKQSGPPRRQVFENPQELLSQVQVAATRIWTLTQKLQGAGVDKAFNVEFCSLLFLSATQPCHALQNVSNLNSPIAIY
jgi:hypothetical protein